MSDYARMLEKAQILTALFWDGMIAQAQVDEVAQKRMGVPQGVSFAMSPPDKPDDWVPTGSLPMPTKTVEVDHQEMVVGKDGKLSPVEPAGGPKPEPPPQHTASGSGGSHGSQARR